MRNESDIELRTGLDLDRLDNHYPIALEAKRGYLIEAQMAQKAWDYLITGVLAPMFAKEKIIQSYMDGGLSNFYIQILFDKRDEIESYIDLFLADERFEMYNEERDIAKRVNDDWKQGAYIRYNIHPTREFTDELTEMFAGKSKGYAKKTIFGTYKFSIYLDFFPATDGDCQITDLGEVEVKYTQHVFEVTCGEGATEMRELLNGSSE